MIVDNKNAKIDEKISKPITSTITKKAIRTRKNNLSKVFYGK